MKVPLLDPRRQNGPLAAELTSAFGRVLASGQYILGAEVHAFEEHIAAVAGAPHVIGVSSGTDAILLALMTLGIGPGDEVICPAFTFFATAGCVARAGARPVFVDSCPVCFNMDPAGLARAITSRTRAIIPVHLFGQTAHMDEILEIAEPRGIPVIEDAAQSLGATDHGRPAGSMGLFGTFSFFPSKNLGAFGDAGLLVTSDSALAEKARILRVHGARAKYFHDMVGANFRIDALQAALLGVKLPHLESYSRARARHAAAYTAALSGLDGVAAHQDDPAARARAACIILPSAHKGNCHIWNQYTLRVAAGANWRGAESPRDVFRAFLQARGIASEIYYPRPMHLQDCFASFGPHPPLPVCERLATEAVSIPVFSELTGGEHDLVISAIGAFLRESA